MNDFLVGQNFSVAFAENDDAHLRSDLRLLMQGSDL